MSYKIHKKSTGYYLALFLVLFLPITIISCGANVAFKRTTNYIYAWPNIGYMSDNKIAIGVIDRRPYVMSGKVKPTFVGLMRGGYGNPFRMHTESGKPLANDISQAVVSGLKNAGMNADVVPLAFDKSQNEINTLLIELKSYKKILITIKEWKSDTFRTTKFLNDLTIEIYDEEGKITASYSESNTDKKGTPVISPLEAGRNILTKLLNDKKIKAALQ